MAVTRLLVFGDIHLKPVETTIDFDKLAVPPAVDVVVVVGDVVHDTRDGALEYGREFFERLAAFDRPVVVVPGNHDPLESYPELVDGLPNVINAHDRIVDASAFDDSGVEYRCELQFVGWGCEQFDQKPALDPATFPALTPDESAVDGRYAADQVARRIEDELYEYVTGNRNGRDLLASFGIRDDNRSAFLDRLERTTADFDRLSELLEETTGPTVVLSHVPPYNTRADRHHSIGTREADLAGLHVGSLGLKLALRDRTPLAALHGHSHNPEFDLFGETDTVHSLNVGFRGIATVTVDADSSGFSFDRLAVDE